MNSYTILDARLVSAPKQIDAAGKALTTLRVADNPQGLKKDADPAQEKRRARFVTLKAWEKQAELMAKLSKNDVISVTGELVKEAFKDKATGEEREDDVMRVISFKVQKSDSFYGQGDSQAEDAPAERKSKRPF